MHPILLKIGPFTLYGYGAMIAVGFLTAVWFAARRARRIGLDPTHIQNAALTALLFGVVGARVTYIALHWPSYRGNWLEMVRLDHGGLVFYGGFAGGLAAAAWAIRRRKLPFWTTADLLAPPLALAHAFGRVGCFLNGCCYGKPSGVPWAVSFPGEGIPRHPTQLYEAAFLLVLFVLLKVLEWKSPRAGTVLLTYGSAYGIWRFFVEFFRGDNPAAWAGLSVFQWASAALVLVSGFFLVKIRSRAR